MLSVMEDEKEDENKLFILQCPSNYYKQHMIIFTSFRFKWLQIHEFRNQRTCNFKPRKLIPMNQSIFSLLKCKQKQINIRM